MFRFVFLLPLLAAAANAQPIRLPAPKNGVDYSARDRWAAPESREPRGGWTPDDEYSPPGGWEPNDTRRPRTGQSGWQFHPSNKWKAPRDTKAEKRRDAARRRRQYGTSRLHAE